MITSNAFPSITASLTIGIVHKPGSKLDCMCSHGSSCCALQISCSLTSPTQHRAFTRLSIRSLPTLQWSMSRCRQCSTPMRFMLDTYNSFYARVIPFLPSSLSRQGTPPGWEYFLQTGRIDVFTHPLLHRGSIPLDTSSSTISAQARDPGTVAGVGSPKPSPSVVNRSTKPTDVRGRQKSTATESKTSRGGATTRRHSMNRAVWRRGMCARASGTNSTPTTSPTPRKFYVRPDQTGKVAGAALGTLLRLGTGALVDGYRVSFVKEPTTEEKTYSVARVAGYRVHEESKKGTWARPEQPLEFWEFESCPFCRKAREAVTLLDLDAIYYPVTDRSGTPDTFRSMAKKIADDAGLEGRQRFPMLRDPNTGKVMYESDDIIQYLYQNYGDGSTPPLMLRMGFLTALTCGLASLAQGGAGGSYKPAKKAEQNLVLWSYEGSPFCKVVRAKLNELAIPHLIISVPRGSAKRQQLYEMTGTFQAPYLEDPNTGVKMYESAEIVDYLEREYALAST